MTLLAGLILTVLAVSSSSAGTLLSQESFDSDPGWAAGGGGAAWSATVFTNGQALLQYTNPATTDPDNIGPWLASFSPTDPAWKVTFQPNQPLELRTQVLNVNQENAFAVLGVLSSDHNGYLVMVERNEVVLMKTATTPTGEVRSYFFWKLLSPTQMTNLILAAAFSQVGADLSIRVRLLDAPSQTLLWQTNVVDTAGLDPVLPNRAIRNLLMEPEGIPAPYVGIELTPLVGICYLNAYIPPTLPVEVTMDNVQVVEYAAPAAEIERDVCISWPEGTLEEQVVVAADSLTHAVWTPCPEPIFKRLGELCVAVPITRTEQYFKLVPGRQFTDDFSAAWGPFTDRDSWMSLYQDATEQWVVTNGVLQLKCNSPFQYGFALLPLGMNVEARHGDFCISVDVLDWHTSGTNWSGIMLLGRADPSSGINYAGGLILNRGGISGKVLPFIHYDYPTTTSVRGSTNDVQLPYRLQFSGVGTRLTLRVLNPTNGQLIEEVSKPDAPLGIGLVGLYVEGRFDAGDSFTITVDNFSMTGTKPLTGL